MKANIPRNAIKRDFFIVILHKNKTGLTDVSKGQTGHCLD